MTDGSVPERRNGSVPERRDGFETRAIHEGNRPTPSPGAVVTPITLSSTFVHEEVGKHSGYEYARSGNPTRRAYEECLASLEGALDGFAFASGMAAEDAVLRLLAPGQRVIIPDDAYGGTFRLVSKVLAPAGIEWTVADLTDLDALERDWPEGTALGVGRDTHQPHAHDRRHRRLVRARAPSAARASSSTTPSPHPSCSDRSSWAPTSWCTRPPSTSAGTPTSWVASSPPAIPRSPSASGSCRTRWAQSRARSTATSSCAGSRRSRCAWSVTARTPARSSPCWCGTRRWRVSSIPHLPTTRATRSRAVRCATSAAW